MHTIILLMALLAFLTVVFVSLHLFGCIILLLSRLPVAESKIHHPNATRPKYFDNRRTIRNYRIVQSGGNERFAQVRTVRPGPNGGAPPGGGEGSEKSHYTVKEFVGTFFEMKIIKSKI